MKDKWTEEELKKVSDSLEGKGPEAAFRWVIDNFDAKDFMLACSFAECVLIDMLVRLKKDARIFFIDTGFLFKETLDNVAKVEEKYGIKVERVRPKMTPAELEKKYGPELWKREPDKCCELLKVHPLKEALSGVKVWITGLRREEAPTRASAPIVGWDAKFGLIKVNPIADWTRKQVWDYVTANGVPYNELLDKGYPSIGCQPCTNPVKPGEDERAGRWAGFEKKECGLHK